MTPLNSMTIVRLEKMVADHVATRFPRGYLMLPQDIGAPTHPLCKGWKPNPRLDTPNRALP